MTRVILGKSRVRESRMPGSVRAKAEWLSYSTMTAEFSRRAHSDGVRPGLTISLGHMSMSIMKFSREKEWTRFLVTMWRSWS